MCTVEPIRKGAVVRVTTDERGPVVLIWLTHEVKCAGCNTVHVALRNRGGATRCARCDELSKETPQ